MSDMYILDGKTPVAEPDVIKWGEWMEKANRTVRKDTATVKVSGQNIGQVRVSTVFLGIDRSFGGGQPLLFETMVFGGALDEELDRCSTWEAAEKMHELMCERVKNSCARVRVNQQTNRNCEMSIKIELELDHETAMALAQFCKRAGWTEFRACAVNHEEACKISDGIGTLQRALAEQGFAPR